MELGLDIHSTKNEERWCTSSRWKEGRQQQQQQLCLVIFCSPSLSTDQVLGQGFFSFLPSFPYALKRVTHHIGRTYSRYFLSSRLLEKNFVILIKHFCFLFCLDAPGCCQCQSVNQLLFVSVQFVGLLLLLLLFSASFSFSAALLILFVVFAAAHSSTGSGKLSWVSGLQHGGKFWKIKKRNNFFYKEAIWV